MAEAEVKGDWTEQNIFVGSGQLIGSVGFNSDKTQFTGIAYVKDANEPNALEALWLKLDVDPYQINASVGQSSKVAKRSKWCSGAPNPLMHSRKGTS